MPREHTYAFHSLLPNFDSDKNAKFGLVFPRFGSGFQTKQRIGNSKQKAEQRSLAYVLPKFRNFGPRNSGESHIHLLRNGRDKWGTFLARLAAPVKSISEVGCQAELEKLIIRTCRPSLP